MRVVQSLACLSAFIALTHCIGLSAELAADAGTSAKLDGGPEIADSGSLVGVDAGSGLDAGAADAGPRDAGTSAAPDAGAPHISVFTGAPTDVVAGSPAKLQWVLSGGAPSDLTLGVVSVLGTSSAEVWPTEATTYTLTASNSAGSASATVTIQVGALPGPAIDARKLPAEQPGWSDKRIEPTSMPIGAGDPSSVGAFRLGCFFAKMTFDDPLLLPRKPGASPLLTAFGNVGVDAWSTDTSIQSSGNSTCSGGILNRTGYWVPAMIDTTDGTPIAPSAMLVYYKTGYGGVKAADVKPVPVGLHMVGGRRSGKSAATAWGGRFSCVGGDLGVGWQTTLPTNCYQNNSMIFEVAFPQCWDGVNLDSSDHISHMADTTGTGCPPTHPVALPEITYEIYYDLANVDLSRMAKWRLSTDSYDPQLPAGYSASGEYVYGWDKATMQTFITNCDNTGADCHANLLGDGTWLY